MDITTLAAWGEFLGGIALVVSLIYLAGQIRQNSKLLRASTASATSATTSDFNSLVVQDSESPGSSARGGPIAPPCLRTTCRGSTLCSRWAPARRRVAGRFFSAREDALDLVVVAEQHVDAGVEQLADALTEALHDERVAQFSTSRLR